MNPRRPFGCAFPNQFVKYVPTLMNVSDAPPTSTAIHTPRYTSEPVTGIEPVYPAWKAGILAIVLHGLIY